MAEKAKYEFRRFDDRSLSSTEASWKRQLSKHSSEVIPTEYERKLAWAREHATYGKDEEIFAYGVFRDGGLIASAIVDVVYTKAGRKWLKLLDINLTPDLDLSFNSDKPDLDAIGDVFTAAITGVIALGAVHPAKETKLYGRSGTLLSFLKGLGAHLNGDGGKLIRGKIEVLMEGRWLVFRRKSK